MKFTLCEKLTILKFTIIHSVIRCLTGFYCIPSVVRGMATQTMAAADIMNEFALNTGLVSDSSTPRRYLWTDAFAVCNFVELYKQNGEKKYLELALKLVDQVKYDFSLLHIHAIRV